jgi:hypothetical protein
MPLVIRGVTEHDGVTRAWNHVSSAPTFLTIVNIIRGEEPPADSVTDPAAQGNPSLRPEGSDALALGGTDKQSLSVAPGRVDDSVNHHGFRSLERTPPVATIRRPIRGEEPPTDSVTDRGTPRESQVYFFLR